MTRCTAEIVGTFADVRATLRAEGYSDALIDEAKDRYLAWMEDGDPHAHRHYCEDDVQRLRVLINMRIFGMAP